MTASSMGWKQRLLHGAKPTEEQSMTTTGGDIQSGEPAEIYVAANYIEAQAIKAYLESNDIPVFLLDEAIGSTLGLTYGPLAQVRVLVPAPLADRAQELLLEPDEAGDEGDQEEA